MKNIDCSELVSYILVRQLRQVRNLIQSEYIWPRIAFFGESPDFQSTFCDYLDNFYDVSKKRNLIEADYFDNDDAINFSRAVTDLAVQGIVCGLNFADQISLEKDINGVRHDSAFENREKLALKYLTTGFDLPETFDMVEVSSISHLDQLVAGALVDNLIRGCYENFVIYSGAKDS